MAQIQVLREEKGNLLGDLLSGVGQGIQKSAPDAIDQILIQRAGGDPNKLSPRLQEILASQQINQQKIQQSGIQTQQAEFNLKKAKRQQELQDAQQIADKGRMFESMVSERLPNQTENEKSQFMDRANDKFANIQNPEKRFQETRKDIERSKSQINDVLRSAEKKISKFIPLSRSQASELSDQVTKLNLKGIDIDEIEEGFLGLNLSEADHEKVFSGSYAKTEKLLRNITVRSTQKFDENQINKMIKSTEDYLKTGGSIKLYRGDLQGKGYSAKEIENLLRVASKKITLSPRQESQLITQDSATRNRLAAIFGRV